MKKILGVFICWCVMLGINTVYANDTKVLNTRGAVVDIVEDRAVIKAHSKSQDVSLYMTPRTYYVENSAGKKVTKDAVKKGEVVSAYYGPMLTKSIPPIGTAILLIVGAGDMSSDYLRVSKVELLDDSAKVYYDNKIMHINEAALHGYKNLRPGDEVLSWYSLMNATSATEFTASKALVLNRDITEVSSKLDAGRNIYLDGKLLVAGVKIYENAGTTYIPVRNIADALGYTLTWNATNQSIHLQKGVESASLQVGSKDYADGKVRVVLEHAPRIIEGQTVAPRDFFTDVLNKKLEVK